MTDGDVFLFNCENMQNEKDYLSDGFGQWKRSHQKPLPESNPVVVLVVRYCTRSQKKFKKKVWQLTDSTRRALVQYCGVVPSDLPQPHGNSKYSTTPYFRTLESTKQRLKQSVLQGKTAGKIYQDESVSSGQIDPALLAISAPRNRKQVENIKQQCQSQNVSKDELYNLLLLHSELKSSEDSPILNYSLVPSLSIVFACRENIQMFNEMVTVLFKKKYSHIPIPVHVDTTFKLGDFWVTPVSFRMKFLVGDPIEPLAYFLHQSREQVAHEDFFTVLVRKIPKLNHKRVTFVSDREKAVTNSISLKAPLAALLYCWNHAKGDGENWLVEAGLDKESISGYKKSIESLLLSDSEEDFISRCETMKKNDWDPKFTQYFEKYLKSDFENHLCKYVVVGRNLYSSLSGITNNPAESMNNVLKYPNGFKELITDERSICLMNSKKNGDTCAKFLAHVLFTNEELASGTATVIHRVDLGG